MRTAFIALGVAMYLATGVVPYLASTLVAPPVGVAFLAAGWAAGLAAAVLLARRQSLWVLATAPLALAFWAAVVSAGERFLGWTA